MHDGWSMTVRSFRPSARVLILCALGTALTVGGCGTWISDGGRACTEIGCSSGYTLGLRPSEARFDAGRYDLRLVAAGDSSRSCSFVVSDEAGQCASGHCVTEEDCNAIYVVGYSEPDRIDVTYPVLDPPLHVSVEHDGDTVADTTLDPTYEILQPNGPGCPPRCLVAGDELIFD